VTAASRRFHNVTYYGPPGHSESIRRPHGTGSGIVREANGGPAFDSDTRPPSADRGGYGKMAFGALPEYLSGMDTGKSPSPWTSTTSHPQERCLRIASIGML
jgi:hypothetical protein